MSKAEKAEHRALETYPVLMCYNDFQMVEEDINKPLREIYQEGYHQAEKDLELSWEDIPKIVSIFEQLKISWWFCDNERKKQIDTQVFWEEVLKQFKAQKGE